MDDEADASDRSASVEGDEDLVQVNHLVPKSVKEEAKKNTDEWGELSDAVREVYRLFARHGSFGDVGRLEVKLLKAERDRERIREQIEELERQYDAVESREERLREEIEAHEGRGEEYESLLVEIESEIRDGVSVFPEHGMVQEAAVLGSKDPEAVIGELRERNPELPDAAFIERRKSDEEWTGVGSDISIDGDT